MKRLLETSLMQILNLEPINHTNCKFSCKTVCNQFSNYQSEHLSSHSIKFEKIPPIVPDYIWSL